MSAMAHQPTGLSVRSAGLCTNVRLSRSERLFTGARETPSVVLEKIRQSRQTPGYTALENRVSVGANKRRRVMSFNLGKSKATPSARVEHWSTGGLPAGSWDMMSHPSPTAHRGPLLLLTLTLSSPHRPSSPSNLHPRNDWGHTSEAVRAVWLRATLTSSEVQHRVIEEVYRGHREGSPWTNERVDGGRVGPPRWASSSIGLSLLYVATPFRIDLSSDPLCIPSHHEPKCIINLLLETLQNLLPDRPQPNVRNAWTYWLAPLLTALVTLCFPLTELNLQSTSAGTPLPSCSPPFLRALLTARRSAYLTLNDPIARLSLYHQAIPHSTTARSRVCEGLDAGSNDNGSTNGFITRQYQLFLVCFVQSRPWDQSWREEEGVKRMLNTGAGGSELLVWSFLVYGARVGVVLSCHNI
ncbi:hypothetical protein DFP72DRAFT_1045697 [Ephemerocybe angulata]|uniref:Uncharacterized protein n=1 Tax=Ephemerocybe angulata TaxID=980116 RepID=A0A8H6M5B3_9AGAR|nr:hypothetical protein DFP72DRAFT_1045697 [Tulosesus angulatus]